MLGGVYPSLIAFIQYELLLTAFFTRWLALDHIDIYLTWRMRQLGSYNDYLFIVPFHTYMGQVYYWYRDQSPGWEDWKVGEWLWRIIHPPSFRRFKIHMVKKKKAFKNSITSSQYTFTENVPWNWDPFKNRLICMPCNDNSHHIMLCAMHLDVLISGKKDEDDLRVPSIILFDSFRSDIMFANYTFFLVNCFYEIIEWVKKQDGNDVDSIQHPDWESFMTKRRNQCQSLSDPAIEPPFFNKKNTKMVWSPSSGIQPDGAACGVFTSLNGSMLIETIQDDNLWAKINNAMDLDTLVVKPF